MTQTEAEQKSKELNTSYPENSYGNWVPYIVNQDDLYKSGWGITTKSNQYFYYRGMILKNN